MSASSYCAQPGSAYPWAPLKRYISENQGSLKRMYGEFRQSNVVQEEIDRFSARYTMLESDSFTEFEIRRARSSNGFVVDSLDDLPTFTSLLASTSTTPLPPTTPSSSTPPSSPTTTPPPPTASLSSSPSDSPTTPPPTSLPETTQPPAAETFEEEPEESSTHVLTFEDALAEREPLPAEPVDNSLPETEEREEGAGKEAAKGYPACPIAQEVVAPYWANNTRGETLALLNVYPFEQYIHWEKCAHEGEQMFCREGCKCEQQYRLHRLLAFDPKSECRGIFADWFRFPGSCTCVCYDSLPDRINSRKARL